MTMRIPFPLLKNMPRTKALRLRAGYEIERRKLDVIMRRERHRPEPHQPLSLRLWYKLVKVKMAAASRRLPKTRDSR